MHFHLPKPLHGWREFAGEVGIIVVGVLIALAAERLVSEWQWRSDVRDADERMRTQLSFDVDLAFERSAIEPCLRPRLAELRDQLLKNDSTWPGSRVKLADDVFKSGFPSVYRTPGRAWALASWQNAQTSGVMAHFQPDRAQQLGGLFDTVSLLKQGQSEEEGISESLGDLAFSGPISSAERRANLKTVARLDAIDARIRFDAMVLIHDAHSAGIGPDAGELKQLLGQQRSYRGACVRSPERPTR
jgi:hypothetical protein